MKETPTSENLSLPRCRWCNLRNPRYVAYHDHEWGRLNLDEQYLYELFILETFQAGLSWECVLNKREAFRRAYENFDVRQVAAFDEKKVRALMTQASIIRSERKIRASIINSQIYLQIVAERGSWAAYLQDFSGGKISCEVGATTNALSDAISRDLKARGMKFVGSVTIYSYLQAMGIINSHEPECFLGIHTPCV